MSHMSDMIKPIVINAMCDIFSRLRSSNQPSLSNPVVIEYVHNPSFVVGANNISQRNQPLVRIMMRSVLLVKVTTMRIIRQILIKSL